MTTHENVMAASESSSLPEGSSNEMSVADIVSNESDVNKGNEKISGANESSVSDYEEKERLWRKRERAFQSELSGLKKQKEQLEGVINQFIQPPVQSASQVSPQVDNSGTVEEQVINVLGKLDQARARQEKERVVNDFAKRMKSATLDDPKLALAIEENGHLVSPAVLELCVELRENFDTDKVLADLLVNEPGELERISSLSKKQQSLELVEKAFQYRIKRMAKTTSAPTPIEPVRTGATQSTNINNRTYEEHLLNIRERQKQRFNR